ESTFLLSSPQQLLKLWKNASVEENGIRITTLKRTLRVQARPVFWPSYGNIGRILVGPNHHLQIAGSPLFVVRILDRAKELVQLDQLIRHSVRLACARKDGVRR